MMLPNINDLKMSILHLNLFKVFFQVKFLLLIQHGWHQIHNLTMLKILPIEKHKLFLFQNKFPILKFHIQNLSTHILTQIQNPISEDSLIMFRQSVNSIINQLKPN